MNGSGVRKGEGQGFSQSLVGKWKVPWNLKKNFGKSRRNGEKKQKYKWKESVTFDDVKTSKFASSK